MNGTPTDESLPVTTVTGPLGAGKTTLLNRVLRNPGDRRLAVVVNDMGELNVDAELIEREGGDGVVDLSNGCICCRLQGDLVEAATRIAEDRDVDALVVEASGISEPIPIARTLTEGTDRPFHLDTMVSVIDAFGFWKAFDPEVEPPGNDPGRPLTDVLVDATEFCDVLLLNKCDTVPDDELDRVEATIRELQTRATVYRTTHCDVPTDAVVDTGRFDFEEARQSQGWMRALERERDGEGGDHEHGHGNGDGSDHDENEHAHVHPSPAERHGVESFVFESERPFDPEALDAWFERWDGHLVRAKGFAYVASRPDEVVGVSLAGPSVQAGPIGEWGGDIPRTRLVLIGRELDREAVVGELEGLLADPSAVGERPDPFPRGP
jgi:G3E family GTPase